LITQEKSLFCERERLFPKESAMRDYALHQAQIAGSLPGAGLLENLIRNWLARRAVRRLQDLDGHLLRDIGATTDDVRWAATRPLTENAALALDERIRGLKAEITRNPKHVV
jgi:uncharacterized protein YjiS (DUF1127 family)